MKETEFTLNPDALRARLEDIQIEGGFTDAQFKVFMYAVRKELEFRLDHVVEDFECDPDGFVEETILPDNWETEDAY